MPDPKVLRRFLTPPPNSKITLQRPADIPSSSTRAVPNPSPQKRRRLQLSTKSRPSQIGAQQAEIAQDAVAQFCEPNDDVVDSVSSEQVLGSDQVWGGEEGDAIPFNFDEMLSSPLQSTTADTYELFAEAVMAEAIPFFQLAPELYVVTGWDPWAGKRTVSEIFYGLKTSLTFETVSTNGIMFKWTGANWGAQFLSATVPVPKRKDRAYINVTWLKKVHPAVGFQKVELRLV